jgi:DNA-binding MarR family transcriptional regulator
MYSPEDRAANLLGALALLVDGRVRGAVAGPAGAGGVLAEAVVVLKDQPGVTADWLGRALGVTQPGAAHVVKRLVTLGWVDKRPGADARSRALVLTAAGKAAAGSILDARRRALRGLVDQLSGRQRAQLAEIAEVLLRPLPRDERELAALCRLCERSRCPSCPVHQGYLSRMVSAGDRAGTPPP